MHHRSSSDALSASLLPAGFEYAGEGPEIGQTYRYRFSGFVVHEPETLAMRLRRVSAGIAAGMRTSVRTLSQTVVSGLPARTKTPKPDRPEQRAERRSLSIRQPRERLRTRYRLQTLGLALAGHVRLPSPAAALRGVRDFPLTVQAISLACCLAIIGHFHLAERSAEPTGGQSAEAAVAELRLTTGTLAPQKAETGHPAALEEQAYLKPDVWRSARGKTLPIFALEAAELSGLVQGYGSRSKTSGAREDIMTWDERPLAGESPFRPLVLIVAQRRISPDAEPAGSLYLETTRRAALHGLSVARAATPGDLSTKFGTFEVADVVLERGAEAGRPARSCLAFRHAAASVVFRLTGWLCAQPDKVVERPTLAALIGKLTLIGAGADRDLHQIFVDADLRKDLSGASHAARKPSNWLDQTGEKPPLKGSHAQRQGAG
ncbi:MAG: hypothetical protein K2P80_14420 [Beijerinckiaceae bacterium]|nr:hypothetical protein [Beijerinckiaceae bacterium]